MKTANTITVCTVVKPPEAVNLIGGRIYEKAEDAKAHYYMAVKTGPSKYDYLLVYLANGCVWSYSPGGTAPKGFTLMPKGFCLKLTSGE